MSQFISLIFWNTALAGLLGGIVFLAQRHAWLKSRPGLAHFLWLMVLLKLVVPPVYSVPLPKMVSQVPSAIEADSTENLQPAIATISIADQVAQVDPQAAWSWGQIMMAAAAAGSLAIVLVCITRTRGIARLVRLAECGPDWLQEMADVLCRESNIQQVAKVLTIDGCVSPFLWVTRRGPSIVVPSALVGRLNREDLKLIVRHELQHYVRRDHWINLFSITVGALLWWNPVAWWARRELRFVQELCCDASVLANERGQHRRYAETLLHTIDFIASAEAYVPVPTTAFGSCSTFKRRIEMISEKNLSSGMSYMSRLLLLPLSAMLIATSPGLAHDEEQSESLADMRGQIRELRDAVKDLQATLMKLTDRHEERDDDNRRVTRLTRKRMMQMAENADLNDEEFVILLQLGHSVDGNPRRFEKLLFSDDLNDKQRNVMLKLNRDNDHDDDERDIDYDFDEEQNEDYDDDDGEERREDRTRRLDREHLHGMAERADLNDDERDILFELAESVDFNARQFEQLNRRDNLNESQIGVLRKLMRDQDRRAGRAEFRERRQRLERQRRREHLERRLEKRGQHQIVRLNREALNEMAARADLNERERDLLFQLAEKVGLNARQFKELVSKNEKLSDSQQTVAKKLRRLFDRQAERASEEE